jgi:hypothetical protein
MRGSEFSHTFQEFFANPRQHLCQSSQLFHVEQLVMADTFPAKQSPRRQVQIVPRGTISALGEPREAIAQTAVSPASPKINSWLP